MNVRVLVAYNGRRFDMPMLTKEMQRVGMDPCAFARSLRITYFCDPFEMAKKVIDTTSLPQNDRGNVSYKMTDVYRACLSKELVNAHSALSDANGLLEMVQLPIFYDMIVQDIRAETPTNWIFVNNFIVLIQQLSKKKTTTSKQPQAQDTTSRKRSENPFLISFDKANKKLRQANHLLDLPSASSCDILSSSSSSPSSPSSSSSSSLLSSSCSSSSSLDSPAISIS